MKIVHRGYIYEAVITKDYLLKLAKGSVEKLKSARSSAESIIKSTNIPVSESDKTKMIPIIAKFILTDEVPPNIVAFIHDLAVDGKINWLYRLGTDSSKEDFLNLIGEYERSKMSNGDVLFHEESCVWLRVKLFHDFGDGFKWVVALDDSGEPIGYMPTHITNKTMRHCGNEPSVIEGDVYYGLRDSNNREYVTVILDEDGNIKESKGYNNAPPKNKSEINKYMQWLMMHPIVKGTSYDNGYARHMNYGVSQMIDDDDFVNKVEKEKPELINKEVDSIILDWKKRLKNGEVSVDQLKDMYLDKEFMFEHLVGIVGRNPFTESEMVKYIKERKIDAIEVGNAGTQYLTLPVQHAFIDNDDYRALLEIFNNLPNNKIDFQYIINHCYNSDHNPDNVNEGNSLPQLIRNIDIDKKLKIFDEYTIPSDDLKKILFTEVKNIPNNISRDEDGNMTVTKYDSEQAKVIEKIIKKGNLGAEVMNSRTIGGYLLAVSAITHPNILRIFIEHGLDPNEQLVIDNLQGRGSETLFDRSLHLSEVSLESQSQLLNAGGIVTKENTLRAFLESKWDTFALLLPKKENVKEFINNFHLHNAEHNLLMYVAENIDRFNSFPRDLVNVLDVLFKNGANPNILNPNGKNCIDFLLFVNGKYNLSSTEEYDLITIFIKTVLEHGFKLTEDLYEKYSDIVRNLKYVADYDRKNIINLMSEWIDWED